MVDPTPLQWDGVHEWEIRYFTPQDGKTSQVDRRSSLSQAKKQYLLHHEDIFKSLVEDYGDGEWTAADAKDYDGYSKSWLHKSKERNMIEKVGRRNDNVGNKWKVSNDIVRELEDTS